MKIWQRNAVVAVVVLFVAVSVYLSWSYNQDTETNGNVPVYVPQGTSSIQPSVSPSAGAAMSTDDAAYFAEARLTRQQARDSALAILNDAAAQTSTTQEAKDQAAASIQTLADSALTEATIEGLVKAKGYADCVAYISDKKIKLIVAAPESGLTAADVTKIKDICMSEVSSEIGDISIIEV